MLAVDTNVLVRLLARDDATQALAADQAIAKGAWISHLVLAEAIRVLDAVYTRTPKQLIAADSGDRFELLELNVPPDIRSCRQLRARQAVQTNSLFRRRQRKTAVQLRWNAHAKLAAIALFGQRPRYGFVAGLHVGHCAGYNFLDAFESGLGRLRQPAQRWKFGAQRHMLVVFR